MKNAPPVAVTGLGCLCAAGTTLPACLTALDTARRSPELPTRIAFDKTPSPVFALPERFFKRGPEEDCMSHTVRMGLAASREALVDAAFSVDALRGQRVGVCLGTSVGASLNFLDWYIAMREHKATEHVDLWRYTEGNPALAVARTLGLTGPVLTVANACSSGTDAIGIAASWLRDGLCDYALAGGADELSPVTYAGFMRLMITDDEPCKPFDVRRRGLNLGEGAGVLLLERAPDTRSARTRGFVLGYGTAADAYHLTAPHPGGRGLKAALADALSQAGINACDVSFINAHGTGTKNNDQVESAVARELFPGVPVVATKGMTGHTLGAAGALEAVFTLAHLERGQVPPSAGFEEVDPELGLTPTTRISAFAGAVAVSQSLAFGGNNSVLVLGGCGA